MPFPIGASHSLELQYLFDVGDAPPLDPAQQVLSDQMIDYWSAFVSRRRTERATACPSGPRSVTTAGAENRLSFKPDDIRVVDDFERVHQCPFWAGLK